MNTGNVTKAIIKYFYQHSMKIFPKNVVYEIAIINHLRFSAILYIPIYDFGVPWNTFTEISLRLEQLSHDHRLIKSIYVLMKTLQLTIYLVVKRRIFPSFRFNGEQFYSFTMVFWSLYAKMKLDRLIP